MKGVVPAAGQGTRMGSLTADKPKGMVEVAGDPLLEHVFRTLLEVGVEELVVIVGYEMDAICSYFGDSFDGVPIQYVHQRKQNGLAAALLAAEPYLDEQFVLLNGDNVFVNGIGDVVEEGLKSNVDAALLVETVSWEVARETGVVETDGETVQSIVEKPSDPDSRLVTTGCYVLSPKIFDACRLLRPSDRGEYELSEAVNLLVAAGASVKAVDGEGDRVNVNRPADVELAEELLRRN